MKLAMAVGTNRHYVVHTILGRHFKQTADACGLPAGTFKAMVEEIGDNGKVAIDQVLSKLPDAFPAAVAGPISDSAKRRIDTLATSF